MASQLALSRFKRSINWHRKCLAIVTFAANYLVDISTSMLKVVELVLLIVPPSFLGWR
jgi:hypothetical protein